MTRAFFKYLLSACILLLNGHGFLYAHTNQHFTHYSSIKSPVNSALATSLGDVQNYLSPIFSAGNEKEHYDLKAIFVYDDDDDELISFKKHSSGASYPAPALFAQTSGHYYTPGKKILPFNMHFSYTSCKYLAFKVFRI